MSLSLIHIGLLHGLLLAIVALGIMVSFRLLNFSDLTVEGAYPLGGACMSVLMLHHVPASFALVLACAAGGLLAVLTAQLSLRLGLHSLLAGILVSAMAYSINLRLMGQPNLSLFQTSTLNITVINTGLILSLLAVIKYRFLLCGHGLRLRAVGLNHGFCKHHHISTHRYTSLGLFCSGSLFALSGALIIQVQQFMDVGMGQGMIIHGLAALMMGESLIGTETMKQQITAPILGAVIYQQIQGLVLAAGLPPSDLKVFTALIILALLSCKRRPI